MTSCSRCIKNKYQDILSHHSQRKGSLIFTFKNHSCKGHERYSVQIYPTDVILSLMTSFLLKKKKGAEFSQILLKFTISHCVFYRSFQYFYLTNRLLFEEQLKMILSI